jgi:hypothetical protein
VVVVLPVLGVDAAAAAAACTAAAAPPAAAPVVAAAAAAPSSGTSGVRAPMRSVVGVAGTYSRMLPKGWGPRLGVGFSRYPRSHNNIVSSAGLTPAPGGGKVAATEPSEGVALP